jgi:tellurite resistance protein TerC
MITANFATIGTPGLWLAFGLVVLAMLAIDLGIFHRRAHEVRLGEALAWSAVWIAVALLFNLAVYVWLGPERGLEFLTGYLIEKALSIDNIFVFFVAMSFFAVPAHLQHRVLFWGILGALAMRGIFIAPGAVLLQRFHWLDYPLGGFLVFTGIRLLTHSNRPPQPERNFLYRLFRGAIPSIDEYQGGRFMVLRGGRRYATRLFLVLIAVEGLDIVFAVDSIPAIFAVTRDPFIVYSSNVFAILGLRALYFVLAGMVGRFRYLGVGLSVVLVFVGGKMLLAPIYQLSIGASLAVIAAVLAVAICASLISGDRNRTNQQLEAKP